MTVVGHDAAPVRVSTGSGTAAVAVDPAAVTLLDLLRSGGHREVKEACGEGRCGACAVMVDGALRLACLVPAGRAAGATVETAASPACAPARAAVAGTGAVQCGYCVPGVVVALTWAAAEGAAVDEALDGVICRCGCHVGFREAAVQLGLGGSRTAAARTVDGRADAGAEAP